MSIYNTGAVTVKVGSSEVIGNGTAFTSNVVAGFYFKLTSSAAWYELATVNNATKLQLSTRYADVNYHTIRNPENLASLVVSATHYSGTLSYYPVIQSYVTINASLERFTDDSGGVLAGNASPPGSGTIDYDTGAWTIVLGTPVTATANMSASYRSGDTLTTMPYQIVTDYTSNYKIPELSFGDSNIPYVYTKAVRVIDSTLDLINASTGSNAASIDDLQASVTAIHTTVTNNSASIDTLQTYVTSTYVKIGAIYLFSGTINTNTSASIVAAGRAIVTPVPKGSAFYNASPVDIWSFTATSVAATV